MESKKYMIGLSGGINSMAVLMWLYESGIVPLELHLYYAHFDEHSDDTFQFVADGIRFAKKVFPSVKVKITRNFVLRYFENLKMIPHPVRSPCSYYLKILPMLNYCIDNGINIDLVGYVRKELKRRSEGQVLNLFVEKKYPIGDFDDEWCFGIVEKYLGWYPKIYDIRSEKGERVFKHNNCLPCKNSSMRDLKNVNKYFPEKMEKGVELSNKLKSYWGRDAQAYYTEFGKEDYDAAACDNCIF